jgi:hypothetical protein
MAGDQGKDQSLPGIGGWRMIDDDGPRLKLAIHLIGIHGLSQLRLLRA